MSNALWKERSRKRERSLERLYYWFFVTFYTFFIIQIHVLILCPIIINIVSNLLETVHSMKQTPITGILYFAKIVGFIFVRFIFLIQKLKKVILVKHVLLDLRISLSANNDILPALDATRPMLNKIRLC